MPDGKDSRSAADPPDAAALGYRRFWVPLGTDPDLSDGGFLFQWDESRYVRLLDPESPRAKFTGTSAAPLETLTEIPVLGLLGEPGMGKSTALKIEAQRLKAVTQQDGDQVLPIDLAACGSDVIVCQSIFRSKQYRAWKKNKSRLHLLLDGFDTCLEHVQPLVNLLLERFEQEPRDRLTLRVACRTAAWPADLEAGLRKLWPKDSAFRIFELAPLRKEDVHAIAKARGVGGDEFLKEVDRVGAEQFANRPITLRFLLDSFRKGRELPSRKLDIYREGCLVLSDEEREDLRRAGHPQKLSSGLRFAVAGRLAAVTVFSQRTAVWNAPRGKGVPEGDVLVDELFGGEERFAREVVANVDGRTIRETVDTGLFRSVGPHRLGFSHQTYGEYLAAQYLVDHGLSAAKILRLILHPGSGRVVPQLRETAAWLAALVPEVFNTLLANDAPTLFASENLAPSEAERGRLVRQILQLYDNGELLDLKIVVESGRQREGARLKYIGISDDVKQYIVDKSRRTPVRRAAILMAQFARLSDLQEDLVRVALDDGESHDLRVAAAVAVRTVGNHTSRAALKPLITISSVDDPDDGLRGAGLAANWPENLTGNELFEALTPPKKTNFTGEYQRFLWSEFAVHLKPCDMVRALQWAELHATNSRAEFNPVGRAALNILTVAIDHYRDAQVCDLLTRILVQIAAKPVPALELMRKLAARHDARAAIALRAIRASPDQWTTWGLKRYGLIADGDLRLLLAELETSPDSSVQETIGFLIASILNDAPWPDTDLMEMIFAAARANPILSTAMTPVLGPVELNSEEARNQRAQYEANRRPQEPPAVPETNSNIDDLIALIESQKDVRAFTHICYRLAGTDWQPNEEVLPGWEELQPDIKAHIISAAEMYLKGYCVATISWIDAGEIWFTVTCGYWALRLLAQVAPRVLNALSDDVWYAWMPSVFGDHLQREIPDEVQAVILETAYHRAPARFRELLVGFIDSQNRVGGEVYILDRLTPVWDSKIADLLHAKLSEKALKSRPFRRILSTLLTAGDQAAFAFARDVVLDASNAPLDCLDRPIQSALELLKQDASSAWKIVWPVVQTSSDFAQCLLANFALDPYSRDASRLLNGLGENDLADLDIWLSQHAEEPARSAEIGGETASTGEVKPISSNGCWYQLRVVVMNTLIQRGTTEALDAIRAIKDQAPDEKLKRVEQLALEMVLQKAWRPLSTTELLSLVEEQEQPEVRTEPANPTTLDALLDGSSCLEAVIAGLPALSSDPKLRKKLSAVARYRWYFKELSRVKAETKKYQTAHTLKELFPDFALWQVLEPGDLSAVAAGEFKPGRFAWSLVQRIQNRRSVDDRTLQNYLRILRAAKLLA